MKSLWQEIEFEKRGRLYGTQVADCTVIGAGMAGLLTAYELQKRGFGVIVLEADRVCSGATANTTAKLTAQHGLKYDKLIRKHGLGVAKAYYESNTRGINKYEKLTRELNVECDFSALPAYIYGRYSLYEVEKEALAADKIGAMYRLTKDTSLPFQVKGALRFENQAQFHPLKFAQAIAKNLVIYENTPVIDIEDGKVTTMEGEVRTQYIVNTTHYPIINLPGLYFLRQHQEKSYCISLKTYRTLDGVYLGADEDRSFRSFPEGVIIGGESHRTGENRKGGCLCRLKEKAQEYYPEGEITAVWSNQDAMTHDSLPFIGRYSAFAPRMFVATGFGKWGMSLSAVASELISDLICDRKNEYERLYSPRRVKLKAAFASFAVDAGYSVKGLAEGVFSSKEKRCTHLGCRLLENKDEGVLECPCHGSQFDKTGKVRFSPAKKNIKQS
ncbi:MAG: FAD-dependent oxidoreductase [Ruminococcus sp.]|nr:FAD-dependent oxidoreductase [Ruminococcus sp.]